MCTAARDAALGPIDAVSTGEMKVLSTSGTTRQLFVDASAGGAMNAAQNPWIYVNLGTGTKVAVTDPASFTSKDWDLALKRSLLRTNDGDGGPGAAGVARRGRGAPGGPAAQPGRPRRACARGPAAARPCRRG